MEPQASDLARDTRTRFQLSRPVPFPAKSLAQVPTGQMTNPRLFRGKQTIRPVPKQVSAFDIYSSHFGLSARPFALVPDPDFLFWSTAHQHAFAMLEFGVLTGAPITLITGEIGTGKTTLIQQLLKTVGSGIRIGLVSNSGGQPDELMRWVLMALGQPTPRDATHPGLVAAFQDFLVAEYAAGRRVVLVFDEAQNLCREALEELRMLTNINSGKDELLQLVLVGQPELRHLVEGNGQHQFAQRVVASFHLGALDAPTTADYIAHRLRVAGAATNIFNAAAIDLIHEATGGIPRRINQLCDLALVYAFTADQHNVLRFAVQQVLDDCAFFGANPVRQPEPALL
jgi:type II secretory pathway predicted ATPase ExeA